MRIFTSTTLCLFSKSNLPEYFKKAFWVKICFLLLAVLFVSIFTNGKLLAAGTTYTWNGTTSTAWETASNWSGGVVPTTAENVIVPTSPTGGRFPTISATSGTVGVRDFTINAGATVTQTGGTLQLAHDWKNSGTYTATTGGTVQVTGASGPGADWSTATLNQFFNLIINSAADPGFDNATGSLSIAGNWTDNNTGALSLVKNYTIVFNGSGAQTITTSRGANNSFSDLIINNTSNAVTLANNIVMAGTLTVQKQSTLALSTFNLASPTSVTMVTGSSGASITGTGTLTLGGNITVTSGAGTSGASISCPIALGGNRTFTVADDAGAADDFVVSGVISGANTLTKAGAGRYSPSGSNTYTGLTTISAGTLELGAAGGATNTPLGTAAAGTSITSGAVLDLNGFTLGTAEALTLNGTGVSSGGALTNSSATAASYSGLLTLGSASSIITNAGDINITNTGTITGATFGLTIGGTGTGSIASIIGTTSGTFTKNGTGTWTLSGANTYTGASSIAAGTLIISNNTSLGTVANGTTVTSGAVLQLTNGITVGAEALSLAGIGPSGNAALDNVSGNNTWGGIITLTADATIRNQSGNFTINNASSVVTAGFLLSLGGNSTGGTISGAISGTGAVRKVTAAGIWTLSGNSSYSGATTVQAGTLKIGATGTSPNGPLGTTGAGTSVSSGAVLDLNGFTLATSEALALDGTGISSGGALVNSSATTAATYNGAITLNSASSIGTTSNITLGSGGITGTQDLTKVGTATLNLGSGTVTINALTISAGTLTSTSGTLNIAGAFSTSSGTFNHNSGTVNFNGSAAGQTISSNVTFNILQNNNTNATGLTINSGVGVTVNSTYANNRILALNGSLAIATTSSNAATTGTITVGTAGFLSVAGTLTNSNTTSGAITVNGIFQINQGGFAGAAGGGSNFVYGATGKLVYNNTSGVYGPVDAGHIYYPSTNSPAKVFVTGAGGVNFGSITRTVSDSFSISATITNYCNLILNGDVVLNSGYSFSSCASGTLAYGCTSTLKYNSGGTPTRSGEWGTAITPGNVQVSNNTTLNGNIGNGTICGNLTIDAGSSLYMDFGGSGTSALTVGKDILINGNLSLGFTAGDLTVGGSFTHASSGSTITYNNRAVVFNTALTSTITRSGGGTESFPYFIVNKSSGNVQIASGTSVTVSASSGDVIQLTSGNLDLNGQTLNISGSGGNIKVTGAARSITSSSAATVNISGAKTITSATGGTFSIGSNVTTILTATVDFGASLTTINGTLQLNSSGSVTTNAPTYTSSSALVYNQGGSPSLGAEWTGSTTTVGAGTPQSLTVQGNTTVTTAAARGIATTLSVASGSVFNIGGGALNIGTSAAISGTLQLNASGTIGVTPTYAGTSALIYNQTGAVSTGNEWTGSTTTVGAGIPQAITIQNNTTVTTTANRGVANTLSVASGSVLALGGSLITGGTSTIAGTLQLNNGGTITAAPTYSGTGSTLIYNQGGTAPAMNVEWNSTSATVGVGVPQNVTIQNNTTVTTVANRALTGTLTVVSGSTVALGAGYTAGSTSISGTLQINTGGFVSNAPTYVGTNSKIIYNSGTSYNNSNEWNSTSATVGSGVPQNVTVQGGTTLVTTANRALTGTLSVISGSTVALGAGYTAGSASIAGTLQLNSGGFVSITPTYTNTSTLGYNQGGTPTFGSEWTGNSTTAGSGIPQDVTITNNTTVNMPNSNRGLAGNLSITSGTLVLNASSGDLYLAGNWTRGASSTFTPNNRAVFFNGVNNTQIVTVAGGGTETFNYLLIDKATGGNLTLSSSPATNVTVNATVGNVFEIKNSGGLDLNGQTFTVSGSGGNLFANGGTRNIIGTGGGTFSITGSKTVTGTLLAFGTGVTVQASAAINFGTANLTTINGTFQLNSGGSVSTNAPIYGSSSTLVYNQTGSPTFGLEWTGNSTTPGTGIPKNVTIQGGTSVTMPTTDRGLAGNLNISNGSLTLNATSGNLFVAGTWTRSSSGTFTPNDRKVTFNSATVSTIQAPESLTKNSNGAFGGETFAYLVVDKNASTDNLKLLSNISITRTLTLTKGTLDLDTSDVVLVSNATRTADVDKVLTPSNINVTYSSTGRFIAQRYIGNTSTIRTWRFLTAPFQASDPVTIKDAWQGGQTNTDYLNPSASNAWSGYSTHITGPKNTVSVPYDASKGFDQGAPTTSYSIEYFDNSTGSSRFSNPANTSSTRLMSQLGWGLFVRGDRGVVIGGPNTPTGNTVLEPKGKINIGADVTSTVTPGGVLFNLVGNPYPCTINMEGVEIGGNTFANYSLWDPKAYTNYSNTGKYIPFTWAGTYTSSNSPVTTWANPGTVESGEAFLARSATTSVVFHESDKVPGTSTLNGIQSRPARPSGIGTISFFRSNLAYYDPAVSDYTYIDGVLNLFNPTYNTAVDKFEDVISTLSPSATGAIRILKDATQLSISKEATITSQDTIQLYISTLLQTQHRLALVAKDFVPNSTAVVVDKFKNETKPVSLTNGDSTFVDFDITADPQSNRSDRFMIIITPLSTTPVKFTSVKAALQEQGEVGIQWQVSNELNVRSYVIEKSTDGINYQVLNTINAQNNTTATTYNSTDLTEIKDLNYYRIRSVNLSGELIYSQVVIVKGLNNGHSISVFPNPIKNNVVNIQFVNQPAGKYDIALYNLSGELLHKAMLEGKGNSWSESISIPAHLPAGTYQLEVKSSGTKKVQKIIIQ